MHKKRIPMRMCTGCGEMKPKPELVRVVKAPDQKDEQGNILAAGEISLDATGKKPGRGAYVCKKADCLKAARKSRRFEKKMKKRRLCSIRSFTGESRAVPAGYRRTSS